MEADGGRPSDPAVHARKIRLISHARVLPDERGFSFGQATVAGARDRQTGGKADSSPQIGRVGAPGSG
jgi:hypothetical protein